MLQLLNQKNPVKAHHS